MVRVYRGIVYLSLHNSLKKVYHNKIITRKNFFAKIGRQYLVPKNVRPLVLKEMEKMGLIKTVGKNEIEINEVKIDVEQDTYKLVRMLEKLE